MEKALIHASIYIGVFLAGYFVRWILGPKIDEERGILIHQGKSWIIKKLGG